MNSVVNFLKRKEIYLYLLALLPILSLAMVSIAIILFSVVSLFYFLKNYNNVFKPRRKDWMLFLLFTTPFFFYIMVLIWTDNMSVGFKIIQKNIPFIIIALSIFIFKPFKTIEELKLFNKTYIVASVVLVILTLVFIVFNFSGIVNGVNNYSSVINLRNSIELVPLIGEHPIYFSLLIAMGLLLLFYNKFKSEVLNIVYALFLIFGLIIASSKGVIIAVVVVSVLIIFQEIKRKTKAIITLILFIAGLSFVVYFSPLKTRIEEIIENQYIYPEGVHFNSINLRTAIYNCSFSLINESGLIGFAPGDLQQELNECYKKFNTNAFSDNDYNSHNQYLDYLLSFGILGGVLIIFIFCYYIKIAMNSKDKLYFNFLILFYIVFLFENVLVRNTGIVLFTTFNCLFAFYKTTLRHDNN